MDCKKFELLIVDYIDGQLDDDIAEVCMTHLSRCADCRQLNEDYKSIRGEIKKSEREAPPEHVLESVREYGREHGIIKEVPFYKKWLSSPVLVPAFAVAVTLIVVINTGDDYFKSETAVKEVTSGAGNTARVENDKNTERDEQLTAAQDSPGSPPGELLYSRKDVSRAEDGQDPSTGDVYESEAGGAALIRDKETTDKYKAAGAERQPYENTEERAQPTDKPIHKRKDLMNSYLAAGQGDKQESQASAAESREGEPVEYTYYKRQLERVTLLQYQGDCGESVRQAEKLIRSNPPDPVKRNAYIPQAECYEEMNEYRKAIGVYMKLREIDPSMSGLISGKIKELTRKLNNQTSPSLQ